MRKKMVGAIAIKSFALLVVLAAQLGAPDYLPDSRAAMVGRNGRSLSRTNERNTETLREKIRIINTSRPMRAGLK